MDVAYDAAPITHGAGGTRTYALHLLEELVRLRPAWRFRLYLRGERTDGLEGVLTSPSVTAVNVGSRLNPWRVQAQLPRQLGRDRPRLFHSFGFFSPVAWAGPKVVTVHDLNMYSHVRNWMRPATFADWLDLAVETPASAWSAARVITDSNASRASIERLLRIPARRISVIPLAADPYFAEEPSAAERESAIAIAGGERFVLAVGVLSPQKNLANLISAFGRSGVAESGGRLVLAGADTSGYGAELREIARAAGVGAALTLAGYVTRPQLRALYDRAAVVVVSSHGEGFGLPVVEAMARGTPVLASDQQALPEVVGNPDLLFAPGDVDHLARLLRSALLEPGFAAAARAHSQRRRHDFSWRQTAEATAAVYEQVLGA